jgi:hypothetical protein
LTFVYLAYLPNKLSHRHFVLFATDTWEYDGIKPVKCGFNPDMVDGLDTFGIQSTHLGERLTVIIALNSYNWFTYDIKKKTNTGNIISFETVKSHACKYKRDTVGGVLSMFDHLNG